MSGMPTLLDCFVSLDDGGADDAGAILKRLQYKPRACVVATDCILARETCENYAIRIYIKLAYRLPTYL